ncbi:MAG TPA: PP2C family protein-serine/threonine phosphatase, partial [Pseudonocardiaceae bacterium]|nr:PP2C family protein-serine/threonine phosphatase [Pseudonocardiaceae bacterium]
VLTKLDRKAIHFEDGAMATVSYAIVAPDRDQVTLALAGHPPPVLVGAAGEAALVTAQPGPPVGFRIEKAPYTNTVVTLRPGSALCFYTDGLVERRDSTIDVGLQRLCDAVIAAEPDVVCARIMRRLVGAEPAKDDIAVLVMRRDPAEDDRTNGDSG